MSQRTLRERRPPPGLTGGEASDAGSEKEVRRPAESWSLGVHGRARGDPRLQRSPLAEPWVVLTKGEVQKKMAFLLVHGAPTQL